MNAAGLVGDNICHQRDHRSIIFPEADGITAIGQTAAGEIFLGQGARDGGCVRPALQGTADTCRLIVPDFPQVDNGLAVRLAVPVIRQAKLVANEVLAGPPVVAREAGDRERAIRFEPDLQRPVAARMAGAGTEYIPVAHRVATEGVSNTFKRLRHDRSVAPRGNLVRVRQAPC